MTTLKTILYDPRNACNCKAWTSWHFIAAFHLIQHDYSASFLSPTHANIYNVNHFGGFLMDVTVDWSTCCLGQHSSFCSSASHIIFVVFWCLFKRLAFCLKFSLYFFNVQIQNVYKYWWMENYFLIVRQSTVFMFLSCKFIAAHTETKDTEVGCITDRRDAKKVIQTLLSCWYSHCLLHHLWASKHSETRVNLTKRQDIDGTCVHITYNCYLWKQ